MPTRTPDEIRASIEQNRQELGHSLERLRGEVVRLTDWRSQLSLHQQQAMIAAGDRRVRARRRDRGAGRAHVRRRRARTALSASAARPRPLLQERARDPADAEQAGPDVGADHRPDLRDRTPARSRRSRARARPAAAASAGAWMCWTIHASAPVAGALAQQVDHPLERSPRGTHPLDRGDLRLDREDRLDLQRRPEPGLCAADPARLGAGTRACRSRTTSSAARALGAPGRLTAWPSAPAARPPRPPPARTSPSPPQAVAESITWTRSAWRAELLARLLGRRGRCPTYRRRGGSRRSRCRRRAAARTPRGSRRSTAARWSAASVEVRRRS